MLGFPRTASLFPVSFGHIGDIFDDAFDRSGETRFSVDMEDLGDHNYAVKTTITLIQGKNNIVVDTGNLGQDKEITDALNKEGLKPKF